MHRKYEYLRWTVHHHQHPAGVSACPCENSVTSPNWNLTNIVKTFSSKLGQHPLPGPLIHLCVVWKNKTSHHGIMTPLLLLESCPVLNRSDNRELYIHLDTMTPLRYRKISTISIKICIYLQYLLLSIIIYNYLQAGGEQPHEDQAPAPDRGTTTWPPS